MAVVAGIDVAKASLDVSVSEAPVLRFDLPRNTCISVGSVFEDQINAFGTILLIKQNN